MLAETIAYRNVYIICGYTDMRKSINGLVAILTQKYQIKPDAESLYLFCGKKADRMKAILWEEDGFLLIENGSGGQPDLEGPEGTEEGVESELGIVSGRQVGLRQNL